MSERLNIDDFRVFREHFRQVCGLYFADDKYDRVAGVIDSRMSELGIVCFSQYYRMLTSRPKGMDELAALASLLTVRETHFFRNEDHWRAFGECVLPWIVERNAPSNRRHIRIWSAGCSTGEEAYTAGIVLRRRLPDWANWSIEIIGTDISPAAIAAAKRARYTEHSFRGVPPEIRREYFETAGPGLQRPRADIRRMVRFQEMNLLDEQAMTQMDDVDVVFCCNVLIYFDGSSAENLLSHFHRSLRPGGYLFLGHTESRYGRSAEFASVNACNTFFYKSVPHAARDRRIFPILRHIEDQPSPAVTPKNLPQPSRPGGRRSGKVAPPRHQAKAASCTPEEAPCLDDLRARAIEHFSADENVEARKTFEEILRREPNDPESLLGMALLQAGAGSSEAALQCCEQVLELHPLCAEAYCLMALVHEGLAEDAIAQRELEKAVYLDGAFAIAHFRLAGLHDRAGRQDAAKRAFRNTLRLLADDDQQRVRIYSGGFSTETIARICEQRLGIEPAMVQDFNPSDLVAQPLGAEDAPR